MPVPLKWLCVAVLTAATLRAPVSLAAQELTTRCDPPAGSLGRLTQTQKKAFMESQDMFIAGRYADALAQLRGLLAQLPLNTPAQIAIAERTAEAAIEAREWAYAISLLRPIEEHDDRDCPARTLLARAYAENGQPAERDAEISALNALHKQTPKSPIGNLDMFLLERHSPKNGGSVAIGYVLRPFGPHNTHLSAEISDASGGTILHIELDSDDGDQVYFREIHPDLAAKGDRRFSLDLFGPDRTLPNGRIDHLHALIQFFDGRPTYDTVRERIFAIAEHSDEAQSLLDR
ncbi:MAG TPA: tetratricopeptide repeat protein [Candidatus Angelobacter sp.]|nr:tetratricopeptide repeat protein [Candidatus Angelobacter sp.]